MASSDRIDELKKRFDENPRRFFASLANEYRKAGDLEQAISLCQTHLAEQPSNMNGHVVYGQALFEAGRYDDAKVTFEAALTLDPENLIALRHLGDIACTNGANDQARVWYERVLDADPRNDEIIALLENLQAEEKRTSIETPVASLESIGLMDLSIDFDSALGTPPPATPEALSDLMADPFAEPTTPEFQAWEPPVVDLAPAANEPPVPTADAVPAPAYDESIDMLFGDSLPAEPAPPFVTETMAELYLQQGFTAEALDVYRQLSAASPDDEGLKERVRRVERGDRTSVSLEEVPEQDVVAVDGSAPLTARSYFAGLSARRAVRGNGRARATSLDELFAGGTISPEDEHVALAFAQVAGAVEMGAASVKGKPTAPAASELSLDSVFREADARVTGTVPRQSQTLRFDQFFATAGEDSEPTPPLPVSAPTGEPGSPAELQQFQSWLTGLKKP